MAWTTPQTFATNESPLTSTKLNLNVRDNMRELWHEVAYVEYTSNVSITSAVSTAPQDIVSSGAITYVAAPIIVEFFAPHILTPPNNALKLMLWDDTTDLATIGDVGAVNELYAAPVSAFRRLTPTAASHTYKVRAYMSAGTGTVEGGAGGVNTLAPGYIRVLQRGG